MKLAKVALMLIAFQTSAGWTSAQAEDKRPTVVRFGTEGAYAPWNFATPSGELDGFEIELAKDLCRRMTVTCEFVPQDWDGIFPGLAAGKYDVIMSGMMITDERRKVIEFSEVYASVPNGFGVLGDSPLTALAGTGTIADFEVDAADAERMIETWKPLLTGKVIGVQVSTVNAAFLEKYLSGSVTVREYKTTEQHDLDLLAGRIDAIFANHGALAATKQKPEFAGLVFAGAGIRGGELGRGIALGIRKDDRLLKAMLDEAIPAAVSDGTVSALSTKWFGIDIAPRK